MTPGTACKWNCTGTVPSCPVHFTGQCPRGPATLEPMLEATPLSRALCSSTPPPAGTGRFCLWLLCTCWYESPLLSGSSGECHVPSRCGFPWTWTVPTGLHRFTPQRHSVPRVPTSPRPATLGVKRHHRGLTCISSVTGEASHLLVGSPVTCASSAERCLLMSLPRFESGHHPSLRCWVVGRGRFIQSVPSKGSAASGAVRGAGAPPPAQLYKAA